MCKLARTSPGIRVNSQRPSVNSWTKQSLEGPLSFIILTIMKDILKWFYMLLHLPSLHHLLYENHHVFYYIGRGINKYISVKHLQSATQNLNLPQNPIFMFWILISVMVHIISKALLWTENVNCLNMLDIEAAYTSVLCLGLNSVVETLVVLHLLIFPHLGLYVMVYFYSRATGRKCMWNSKRFNYHTVLKHLVTCAHH